ncbi:hypothetical protein [Halopenitus persicus]|uniref:Uncharacterized protein n=1 Tax=Halopenitus persicus TaxID=1048396 RepID=A0A1H3HPV9_9EURY|nr:hypothetical protein [Halopenitus persicus]SDY17265.1 hypothetical protein SAMN05216564_103369 [Halopenitus persicus]
MIREHVRHLHHVIDDQSLPIRGAITGAALLSLPLFGTGVRALGSALELGQLVLPLLVLAHVPAVIALIAVWSIGCDVCRTGESA